MAVRESSRCRERGAALVEFAFIVPLLSLFLFGIVQFGIAYDMKQSINAAAREGARTAAIPTNDFDEIDDATRAAFRGLVDDGTVTVRVENRTAGFTYDKSRTSPLDAVPGSSAEPCRDPVPTDASLPGTVIVTATVDHVLTIPFFGAPTITLTGRGEFRCERAI